MGRLSTTEERLTETGLLPKSLSFFDLDRASCGQRKLNPPEVALGEMSNRGGALSQFFEDGSCETIDRVDECVSVQAFVGPRRHSPRNVLVAAR